MCVSSVTWPRFNPKGPPPAMSLSRCGWRENSFVVPSASPMASPMRAPRARSRSRLTLIPEGGLEDADRRDLRPHEDEIPHDRVVAPGNQLRREEAARDVDLPDPRRLGDEEDVLSEEPAAHLAAGASRLEAPDPPERVAVEVVGGDAPVARDVEPARR